MFGLAEFPGRVVIQGAGYIALEFAGIFNALGAQVTVVNRSDQILRSYDDSMRARLLQIMQARGVEFRFNSPIERVVKGADGVLGVETKGYIAPLPADVVLVATGRRPKTDGLGLESAGVVLGAGGEVPVDEYNAS